MLTRADISRMLGSGLKTTFFKAYDAIPTIYQDYTTKITSTKASEDYGWLGDTPELIEWKSERTPKALREFGFVLKNKKWEASIRVDQDAIDDDQYAQITGRVATMGTRTRRSFDKQFAACIEAGVSTVCYDGQNFFDTDHEEGSSGVQSNLFTTTPLTVANAKTIITAMGDYKSDEGAIVGVSPDTIMVPTALEFVAKQIFNPEVVVASTDPTVAVLKGRVKVVVNPYLSSSGGANAAYYFLDNSQGVKPFIFQERQKLTFSEVTTANPDNNAFMTDSNLYGVKARHAFGYGDWRLAARGIG